MDDYSQKLKDHILHLQQAKHVAIRAHRKHMAELNDWISNIKNDLEKSTKRNQMTDDPTDTMPERIYAGRNFDDTAIWFKSQQLGKIIPNGSTEYIRADLVPDAALLKEAHDALDEYSIMYQQMKEAFIRGAAWHTIEAQRDNMDCAKRGGDTVRDKLAARLKGDV